MKHNFLNFLLQFTILTVFLSCTDSPKETPSLPDGSIADRLAYIENPENFELESERLEALFELYYEYQMSTSPAMATMFGDTTYNHLWDDMSLEGKDLQVKNLGLFHATKDWFDSEKLSDDQKINYAIYNRIIDGEYQLLGSYPEQYLIIDQVNGIHQIIPQILQMMPLNNKNDAEKIIARLHGVPNLLAGLQETLREGLEKGIVMPKNTVVQVPAQLQSLISENPDESVFYSPLGAVNEKIDLENPETIQDIARKAVTNEINPALQAFSDFMQNEYIPNTRETFGLSDLPNGAAWYDERVRYNTTTNLTADEIHELGKQEVERIRHEMLGIMEQVGFEGSLNEFNEFMRNDPQFYFDSPEELMMAYRDICKRIDPMLPKLFGHLPRLPYGIKEIPSYVAKSSPTAYYQPGSLKGGIAGYFNVNTYDLKSRPKYTMEALAIHEAVPGHHLQLAIAQELENVPKFRTTIYLSAYSEGWGLYSESLGEQLGFYTDPYSKYGQLTGEIWRAIRLVVDTGIHKFGWTRDQAINYFKENSGIAENDIIVEVDRYIAWPGQAVSYKIGELKIKELRKIAKEKLGEKFEIRAFHDVVLGSGTIPLDVLEENVDNWIAAESI
ncbi:DUF885 domain-containing protein [Algoriphagus chordae]|uniref:Prolyl oligopeptidase n=1 Tax=Algoriphagus chordae TaxID=237019 RepID=A0A2W7QNB9_9BACT|nr:DUF885 domain-containing protein [Algoriphagus chordae]PZX47550.1 prolyl oligopeptidase [Algoriphagus chordae]